MDGFTSNMLGEVALGSLGHKVVGDVPSYTMPEITSTGLVANQRMMSSMSEAVVPWYSCL